MISTPRVVVMGVFAGLFGACCFVALLLLPNPRISQNFQPTVFGAVVAVAVVAAGCVHLIYKDAARSAPLDARESAARSAIGLDAWIIGLRILVGLALANYLSTFVRYPTALARVSPYMLLSIGVPVAILVLSFRAMSWGCGLALGYHAISAAIRCYDIVSMLPRWSSGVGFASYAAWTIPSFLVCVAAAQASRRLSDRDGFWPGVQIGALATVVVYGLARFGR